MSQRDSGWLLSQSCTRERHRLYCCVWNFCLDVSPTTPIQENLSSSIRSRPTNHPIHHRALVLNELCITNQCLSSSVLDPTWSCPFFTREAECQKQSTETLLYCSYAALFYFFAIFTQLNPIEAEAIVGVTERQIYLIKSRRFNALITITWWWGNRERMGTDKLYSY